MSLQNDGHILSTFQYVQFLSKKVCKRTSSNGNIFRVTGPLCGESTGHRFLAQRPVTRILDVSLDLRLNKHLSIWGGDLRRYRAHYDVTATADLLTVRFQRLAASHCE